MINTRKLWNSTISQLKKAVQGDPFWEMHLNSATMQEGTATFHVAIMVEPYLQYVLDGRKTVESRFSVHRIPPYGRVKRGDILLLKKSGGPITGICQASDVWYYELEPNSWQEIRREFTEMLCAQDPTFWSARQRASFATLIRLQNVKIINPVKFSKLDRRGWVIMQKRAYQMVLPSPSASAIIGFAGGVGSGKSTLSSALADSLGCLRISFGDHVRNEAHKRALGESRDILQRLGAELVNDSDQFCRDVLEQGGWKRKGNLILDGIRHLSVLNSLKRQTKPFKVKLIYIRTEEKIRSNRIQQRRIDNSTLLQSLESHSTESEVHKVLPDHADLILDGSKSIESNLRIILSWLGNEEVLCPGMLMVRGLREKYRPHQIRFLLVAESPPNCEEKEPRFFYNSDNEQYDFMFRNVMTVIFPEFETGYRKGMKRYYLERFCKAGFFMIDATDEPVSKLKGNKRLEAIRRNSEKKLAEIEHIISKKTPIFLITRNVFTVLYQPLRENGYAVAHHVPIPFPGQGHQIRFREEFRRHLAEIGYSSDS